MNYVSILKMEIDEITRATGKNDVHSLGYDDLITTDIDISKGQESLQQSKRNWGNCFICTELIKTMKTGSKIEQ